MYDKHFKNSGLRTLMNEHGDYLITAKEDSKLTLFLKREILEEAKYDERKSAIIGKQLISFLSYHRKSRNTKHR